MTSAPTCTENGPRTEVEDIIVVATSAFVPRVIGRVRLSEISCENRGVPSARDDRAGADESRPSTPRGTRDAPRSKSKSDSHGRRAPRVEQELGTEFGEHRNSRVRQVTFTRARADGPDLISTIRYDSAHALADRGVPIFEEPVFTSPPPRHDGWPGAVDGRFTPPPPPRRR